MEPFHTISPRVVYTDINVNKTKHERSVYRSEEIETSLTRDENSEQV